MDFLAGLFYVMVGIIVCLVVAHLIVFIMILFSHVCENVFCSLCTNLKKLYLRCRFKAGKIVPVVFAEETELAVNIPADDLRLTKVYIV